MKNGAFYIGLIMFVMALWIVLMVLMKIQI